MEDPNQSDATAMNFPNFLSVLRIALIPLFILLFSTPTPARTILSAVVFGLAAATDLLDGYLARRWRQVTSMGKLLDPLADKLLVLSAVILLVSLQRIEGWLAILIIGRELAVTGLRAIAASEGIIIAAEGAGKAKVILQVIALILIILSAHIGPISLHLAGTILLWLSTGLAVSSAIQYALRFNQALRARGRT